MISNLCMHVCACMYDGVRLGFKPIYPVPHIFIFALLIRIQFSHIPISYKLVKRNYFNDKGSDLISRLCASLLMTPKSTAAAVITRYCCV